MGRNWQLAGKRQKWTSWPRGVIKRKQSSSRRSAEWEGLGRERVRSAGEGRSETVFGDLASLVMTVLGVETWYLGTTECIGVHSTHALTRKCCLQPSGEPSHNALWG